MKSFDLRNALTAPAKDEEIVEALIAFANGRDVVIWDQPGPRGPPVRRSSLWREPLQPLGPLRRWSLWREQPKPEERRALVNFLDRLTADSWGCLGFTRDSSGRWRTRNSVIQMPPPLGPEPARDLLPDQDIDSWLGHMSGSMQRELVFVATQRGYSLADFRVFRNVAAALALATSFVMDQARPFAEAFCRCRWCEKFYLARKNPKGGPANRIYCKPEHRKAHHDSAERKNEGRHK